MNNLNFNCIDFSYIANNNATVLNLARNVARRIHDRVTSVFPRAAVINFQLSNGMHHNNARLKCLNAESALLFLELTIFNNLIAVKKFLK